MLHPPQVWVDYNDVDEQHHVLTLQRFFDSSVAPVVGQRVLTGDFEGNRCEGTIVELQERGVVTIELDLDTLVRTEHPTSVER